jgi:hypothetical protein
MPTPVSANVIIDTSASMSSYGYVANTVINSSAFLSYALAGDVISVASYDVNGRTTYPQTTVDASLSQIVAATAAIRALSFNGSCTNITNSGGGVPAGLSLLAASSVSPKAAVLLSDGQQNCGSNPLTQFDYPVFACAMGPASDRNFMQGIATTSHGVFYYAPYPFNMMQIYNQIRGLQPQIRTVVNYTAALSSSQSSMTLPITFSATSQVQQAGVVWSNASYVYSTNPSPTGNQLYVVLYQPNGQIYSGAPALIGSGYVIFNVPTPQPGTWYAYVAYAPSSSNLAVTAGVFEFPVNPSGGIRLEVGAPNEVRAGTPLSVNAKVFDDDEPIETESVTAEIVAPVLSIKNATEKYRDEIAAAKPSEHANGADEREQTGLRALYTHRLPTHDILPHRTIGVVMAPAGDKSSKFVLNDTHQGGTYNVIVRAAGYSGRSKTRFQRTELVSVPVND